MIEPKRMSKVTVIGPSGLMREIIEELHSLRSMHFIDYVKEKEEEIFDIGSPFEDNESYSEFLIKARTILSLLKIKCPHEELKYKINENDSKKRLDEIFEQITILQKRLEYANKAIEIFKGEKQALCLRAISFDIPKELNNSSNACLIGFTSRSLDEELRNSTAKEYVVIDKFEGLDVAALICSKAKKDKFKKLFDSYDFIGIEKPYIKAAMPDLLPALGEKYNKEGQSLEKATKLKLGIISSLDSLKKGNESFLTAFEQYLSKKSDISEAPLRFATSKSTFVVHAWAADKEIAHIQNRLKKIAGEKIHIIIQKPKKTDNVPIALDNKNAIKPFEFFMEMYTLPSYNEIDPSFILFLTFPIFFGFMLGDIGYGIITLILFIALKKHMQEAKSLLNALVISSISTIFFGILFGEFFGLEEFELGHQIIKLPHILSRSHQVTDLLTLSIIIGLIHILLGLTVGFINILRQHGLKQAFLEKGGWMLLLPVFIYLLKLFGIIKGIYAPFVFLFIPPTPVLIFLGIIGTVIVIIGEGIRGVLELPNLLSNILSYGRLMAVGLASVSLAAVINNLAGTLFSKGIFGAICAILILFIGHIINIALGILSPFLHSLRLHYVEFFTKFFHGGGIKFKAFGENNIKRGG